MGKDCIVVVAADANFFELAQGCIQSVRNHAKGQTLTLAFLDVGCTDEQMAWLRTRVDIIEQPDWEHSFPGREQLPGFFKALLARPFLRRRFPGFEVYLWLDADAWVQDWQAVELFLLGARRRQGLAIVPEIDRGSQLQYGGLPTVWNYVRNWYLKNYDATVANQLFSFPVLNAGVFALHREAPHWQIWNECLAAALRKNCTILTDQVALNLAVYKRGTFTRTELLPAWCNWTCHFGLPIWDEQKACLVEPYLPHTAIGIMHLTKQKHRQARLATTLGNRVEVCLHYPAGVIPG